MANKRIHFEKRLIKMDFSYVDLNLVPTKKFQSHPFAEDYRILKH